MDVNWREMMFAGNEVWRFGAFLLALLVVMVFGKLVRIALERAARHLSGGGKDVVAAAMGAVAKSTPLISLALGAKLGVAFLVMGEGLADIISTSLSVLFTLSVGLLFYHLCDVVAAWFERLADKTESEMDNMLIPVVRTSLRVAVVVLIVLQVAQTLTNKPLTSLLAGLGVGGLAVALALQDTIKHFFGSIVIFADKPFVVGERVVVDGHDGAVEELGFRSTRIRRLDGHLVSVPNGELANKTIHNIGKRPYIRRVMNIGVTYDTSPEKVNRALEILKELLENHEGMHPDFPPRVYFSEFEAASLNLIAIYWYHPADYWQYMAFSEKLNLELLRRYNDEKISFAFPTQTMVLVSDPDRPLDASITMKQGMA